MNMETFGGAFEVLLNSGRWRAAHQQNEFLDFGSRANEVCCPLIGGWEPSSLALVCCIKLGELSPPEAAFALAAP